MHQFLMPFDNLLNLTLHMSLFRYMVIWIDCIITHVIHDIHDIPR